jgi:hypothetical protein
VRLVDGDVLIGEPVGRGRHLDEIACAKIEGRVRRQVEHDFLDQRRHAFGGGDGAGQGGNAEHLLRHRDGKVRAHDDLTGKTHPVAQVARRQAGLFGRQRLAAA